MTQEKINKIFETDLGQQCNELFVTFDDRVFIRYEDAQKYLKEHGYDFEWNIETWYRHASNYSIEETITIEQTRDYLVHIISQLDGYTLDSICEYLDITDEDILKHFEQNL